MRMRRQLGVEILRYALLGSAALRMTVKVGTAQPTVLRFRMARGDSVDKSSLFHTIIVHERRNFASWTER